MTSNSGIIVEVVTAGPQGLGSAWQQGAGAPSSGTGGNGDFYLNTTNGDIYGPKTAGAWGSVIFNIAEGQQGPAGPTGAAGVTGPAGAAGRTVLSGSGAPSSGTGAVGDFYIDTTSWVIYGPKASGAWPGGASLIGPAGATGPAGPQGPSGPQGAAATYSDATPQPLGTASAGTAASASRADHVHALPTAAAIGAVSTSDSRLSDSREWTADTIGQAEAEAGTATTRRAFTAQRVFQAVAAWWAASSAKTKLDGIASGATANATDAQLRDRSTHTGTQAAGTITGLATVATTGAYTDLSGRPTLGTAAPLDVAASGDATSGQVVKGNDSRLSDARTPTAHNQAWSTITGTPTTLAGYGITDGGTPPAGSTGQVQYRSAAGAFAGASGLVIDPTSGRLTLASFLAGSAPSAPASGFVLYAGSGNALSWIGANGFTRTFDGTANTANRSYTLQDKSGTVAHVDDITATQAGALPLTFNSNTITYAADVELDMAALNGTYRTISLTGNLSLTSINRAAGRSVVLRLICDSTQRTLTFPSGWVFVGTKPAAIAASKTAVLSLSFFGTASTDAVVAYAVQS